VSKPSTARGAVDILKFFLDKLDNESDVNVQDSIKATPAHDAAEYGQTQAMILLLKAGADLSIQDMVSQHRLSLVPHSQHRRTRPPIS